jgi:PAS domain S-box-containing protein
VWGRRDALQVLAKRELDSIEPDLHRVVTQLAELFQATATTLLLEEQGELRLAASTDPTLGREERVVYERGEGLTGHVFATGQSLRLNDSTNHAEVRRQTGLDRKGPRHPERDRQGATTVQFLGVPIRWGEQVHGVLRMSRTRGEARFTSEDEHTLQFFADLLGIALAHAWDLLLAECIRESVSVPMAVSRRETPIGKQPVPRIILANPGAEKLLGRSRTQLCGLDAREMYAPSAYEEFKPGLLAAFRVALSKGRGEHGPVLTRIQRPDGTQCWLEMSFRILANRRVQPPVFYTIGVARDMTEREQQAAQHRGLMEMLDEMGLAYFRSDMQGVTLESGAAESRVTGYPRNEMIGLNRTLLYPSHRDRKILIDRAICRGGRLVSARQQLRRKDGTRFWAEGDLRVLIDAEGNPRGVEGLYRDVTDRLQLQGFVNARTDKVLMDDELFAKLKENAEFHLDYMSSLGHQLLTPLSSLTGNLRNLERGHLDERRIRERLPYIIGQARVCTRLVRNLSYMDKVLRGEPFHRETVSMARLAIETKLDFLHLLKENRLELHIDDASLNRNLPIHGHREMLRQVIVNLVDNAIKYSLPESTITIRGKYRRREGRVFEITSRGLPIPEQIREEIFKRGFRSNKAKMKVPHGTGLGLWLVRKIVEAHGATINCREIFENEQRYNLFRIIFPHPNADASSRRSR